MEIAERRTARRTGPEALPMTGFVLFIAGFLACIAALVALGWLIIRGIVG